MVITFKLSVNLSLVNYLTMIKSFNNFFGKSNWDRVAIAGVMIWLFIVIIAMIIDAGYKSVYVP